MYVYKFFGSHVKREQIPGWDKNGKVSFTRKLDPCFYFSEGIHCDSSYPYLNGLDWQQVYCLTHLSTYFAKYDPKKDLYKWKRVGDEPFEQKTIFIPGKIVRAWQEN